MGTAKKAFVLSLEDGPIGEAGLKGHIKEEASHGVSIAYDLANNNETRWFLDKVIGSSRRHLDKEIAEFVSGLGVPQEAVELLSSQLEMLDMLKRQGIVRKVYPIGMHGSDEKAVDLTDLDYSYYSGKLSVLQSQFMGKVLMGAEFGELKAMMYSVYDRFKNIFRIKERTITANASEMMQDGRTSDYVIVLLPLYVRPVARDLNANGVDASQVATVRSFERRWQAELLVDALNQLRRSDTDMSGTLSADASLSLSRYTLLRAISSMNSLKDYFYSLRFRYNGSLTEGEKQAVMGIRSDADAMTYYSRKQQDQWKELQRDLPQMRQFLRKEDYRRVEKVATRMKMAA
ncbi:MAG: hypothetical protein KGI00_03135 [Candidatus Micrarchaeota archaeon]|nr:hypothetical protein [Candidatus Micrarchaeota archaeon]MDE1824634.1 hypothetical protein [Candidatus Micrarchaeota archaeon]MDE1849699.1 hypothetical protein [Candidatus Micrarchaeota archaeon]